MATVAATEVRTRTTSLRTWSIALRATEMVVGGVLFILLLEYILGFNLLDAQLWKEYASPFQEGILGTLALVAVVVPVSVVVGFLAGWARVSRHRILTWPIGAFVDFFRGVPPIVIILFALLFGPRFLPVRFVTIDTGLQMATLALALHSAAYQAEIFRAGFQSVQRGQLEAAQALGMRSGQTMRHVVLPQAFRLSLPPLGNEFAVLIKDTSLLSAVGALDMFGLATEFTQQIFTQPPPGVQPQLWWYFAVYTAIAIVYFAMTFVVTRVLLFIEHRVQTPGLEAVSL